MFSLNYPIFDETKYTAPFKKLNLKNAGFRWKGELQQDFNTSSFSVKTN